jgi:large subunit ribosomal protein L7/L12
MSEKKAKETEVAAATGGDGTINKVLELVESMTVLQLADLVKTLEERWGVTAAAPMMAVAPGAGAGAGEESGPAKEEQTEFTVSLKGSGEKKIQVIKVVRELTALGLKEAKDLVDNLGTVKEKVSKEEAQKMKAKLEEVGAVVEVK